MRSLRPSDGGKANTTRALVLEVRNGTSACLKEDGTVVKVHKAYPVGKTIELKENNNKILNFMQEGSRQLGMAVAAIACLFIGTGIFSYNNAITASYMSVDVNPSLEYSLNRVNKVIDVHALNDDAEPIVEALKDAGIVNSTVSRTISETTRILEEEKFIAEDKDNVMLVGITGANQTKSTDISNEVHLVSDEELTDRVSVYTIETSQEDRDEAQKHGVSAGRYSTAKAICDKNNVDINSISEEAFNEISLQSVASLLEENGDKETEEAKVEEEKEKEEKESKPAVKKQEKTEVKTETAAATETVTTAPEQITTASAETEEKEEEKEEKSSSKKDSGSSKKTSSKTVSGSSAAKNTKKTDKGTVSTTSAKSSGTATAGTATTGTATISGNVTETTASEGSAAATEETKTKTTTIVTEDGTVVPVVVPENDLIENPQDMSVGEYEQVYLDKVIETAVPAVTEPAEVKTDETVQNQEKVSTESQQDKANQSGLAEQSEAGETE